MTSDLRVVLAEDSVLLREGLLRLLGDSGFDVVDACPDAETFLRAVEKHQPDLVIVDVVRPERAQRHHAVGQLAAGQVGQQAGNRRVRVTGQAGDPPQVTTARVETDLEEAALEARRFTGQDHVTGQGHVEPGPHRGPVHRGHHGMAKLTEPHHQRVHEFPQFEVHGLTCFRRAQIH